MLAYIQFGAVDVRARSPPSSATCSASTRDASSWSSRSGSRSASSSVALIFLYNVSMTVLKGRTHRRHQRPAAGLVGHRRLLPVRLLQPVEHRRRQAVLVVRRPPLGRGRVGTGDGLGPGLPGHQDDRRGPRGGGEMALRHRRPGPVLRPARHRPPLLLDRRSGLLAVDRQRSSRRWRSLPSSPWWSSPSRWSGRAARPPEQGGLAVGARHAPSAPSSAPASGASCTRCRSSTTTATAPRSPRRTAISPSSAPM